MPAKASLKRPAAAKEGGAAKKRATALDKSTKQYAIVGNAIMGAANFPPHVLEMLNAGMPHGLGVPKEMRHQFHEQVLEMVREVLGSVEAGIQSGIDAAEKQLADAATEKVTREAEAEAAVVAATKKEEATEAALNEHSESVAKLEAAEAVLSAAESAKKAGDAEIEAAASKRARLLSAMTGVFEPLQQGTMSDVAPIVGIGKEFSLEPTLLSTLPNAFAKPPGERGSFDAMVLQQVEAEFTKCAAELDKTIADGEPAKQERAAKVAAVAADVEAAGKAEQACKAAYEMAVAEQKEAESGQKAAAKALRQLGLEVKQATAELDRTKAKLQKFKEGPLAAFQELLDYTLVPPAVEVPPEEEVPEAAEAAPAGAPEEAAP